MNEDESSLSDLLKTEDFSTTFIHQNPKEDNIPENMVNKSIVEISCFPPKIDFTPIYPNSIAYQKLLVINTGIKSEYLSVKLEGSNVFSVNSTGFMLDPDSSHSLIISFRPLKAQDYSATLVLDGRHQLRLSMTGSCLKSPLEIPSEQDPIWSNFHSRQLSAYIPVKNNSKSETLHVEFSTNCNSFKVIPNCLDLNPNSSEHITIKFNPKIEFSKEPHFHAKCEATGDTLTRTLRVISILMINFGSIIVGKSIRKEVNINFKKNCNFEKIREAFTSVKLPFSFYDSDKFFFSFSPKKGGDFHDTVKIYGYQIDLLGEGVEMPFSFNDENLRIQNITNDPISLSFSLDSSSAIIVPKNADLQPNAWTFLNMSRKNTETLSITYHRNDNNDFIWKFIIEKEKDASFINQKEIVENSKINNNNNQSHGSLEDPSEYFIDPKSDMLFPQKDNIVTHPSFISFFQSNTNARFIITGVDSFEADGPSWLKFPPEVDVDSPIDIECKYFPSSTFVDKIIIQSDSSFPHELPIIGYQGRSEIVCVSRSALTYALDNHYVTRIEVSNCGDLPGFVIFTASEKTKHNIRIHPSASIVYPNSTQAFEFIVDSKPEGGLSIPILLYSCDEIMRQMRSIIYNDDFFDSNIPIDSSKIENELRTALQKLKHKEFHSLFKKMLKSKEIELYTFDKSSSLKRLAVFPLHIESSIGKDSQLSIINMSSSNIAAQFRSYNPGINISPINAIIKAYSEITINIHCSRKLESTISVEYEDDTISVPIKCKDSSPAQRYYSSRKKKHKTRMIKSPTS